MVFCRGWMLGIQVRKVMAMAVPHLLHTRDGMSAFVPLRAEISPWMDEEQWCGGRIMLYCSLFMPLMFLQSPNSSK